MRGHRVFVIPGNEPGPMKLNGKFLIMYCMGVAVAPARDYALAPIYHLRNTAGNIATLEGHTECFKVILTQEEGMYML